VRSMRDQIACISFHKFSFKFWFSFVYSRFSIKEDSPLKATDFGLSDFIKPGSYLGSSESVWNLIGQVYSLADHFVF